MCGGELQVFDGIFRCYAVAIGMIVVVAETEWGFVMKFWKVRFHFEALTHFMKIKFQSFETLTV